MNMLNMKYPRTKNRLIGALVTVVFGVSLTSCDKYLDELPDNRMEITTIEKVNKLLTSAYLSNDALYLAEVMSDNIDSYGSSNPYSSRFADQVYSWRDVTESDNQDPERFWEDCYDRIAAANLALEAIDQLDDAADSQRRQARGEALLCRAYAHFMLANVFCQAYSSQTAADNLGIAYMDHPAREITEQPERGTLAETYQKIQSDLEEALTLIGDDYTVPKYHFNTKAAQAFACRFYLYSEQWDKAIYYANLCLGSSPGVQLRDWAYMATMTQTYDALTQHYIDAALNCNLLMLTSYSYMGLVFGPYQYLSRYAHGRFLATHEDGQADNVWGDASFYQGMHTFAATNLDKTIFYKLPYLFEYYDAVAGTGYFRTVYPAFTMDETLLNRAEAYVLTGHYDEAAADLTTWMQNIIETDRVLTPTYVRAFYNAVGYCYDEDGMNSTIKKHLHPKFDIGTEGDMTEAMLQCVLGFRRIETLQAGMRWYDIKRYGIEIVRRVIDANGEPERVTDRLVVDDPRRAVQIPLKVRTAGVQPNPREN